MTENDFKKIIDSAIEGNEFPFDRFFEDTFQKLLPKLTSLTKSREDAQEVFIISLHKFWERFVINQEKLPHNSVGYIYMMCRNAWLLQKRQPWSTVTLSDTPDVYQHHEVNKGESSMETEKHMNDDLLKHKALATAIESLSPKCKTLIEAELDTQVRLKDLQQDLGYRNYQALVQAKYNCKKRLVKKVYEILIDLKNSNPLSR